MKGIAYFIGATFGVALLFAIIIFIFLRRRNINSREISQFIKNSVEILILPTNTIINYSGANPKLGREIIFTIIK